MHIRWNQRQLKTNRQSEETLCIHDWVKKPVTISPALILVQDGRRKTVWRPGPSIRVCCLEEDNLAIASWWWEVDQRFQDLAKEGLPDKDLTEALLEQQEWVEEILELRVPKPTPRMARAYLKYRSNFGVAKRRIRKKTPHDIKTLGLSWPCTLDELKQRWRQVAFQEHPDRGGDTARFITLKEAYTSALTYVT